MATLEKLGEFIDSGNLEGKIPESLEELRQAAWEQAR